MRLSTVTPALITATALAGTVGCNSTSTADGTPEHPTPVHAVAHHTVDGMGKVVGGTGEVIGFVAKGTGRVVDGSGQLIGHVVKGTGHVVDHSGKHVGRVLGHEREEATDPS